MSLQARPIISASVYGKGQHDLLLDAFLREFWEESPLNRADGFLWTLRFGGGGEHTKLRFHGPRELESQTRIALGRVLDDFVASLPPSQPENTVPSQFFPAIDPEDEEEGLRPDRSWRWTTYRPSSFVFGAERLAQDETLAGLFVHAQSAVSDLVMREVAPKRLEAAFPTLRQTIFVRFLIATFAALKSPEFERKAYLLYHRDWLVRSLLTKTRSPGVTAGKILEPLHRRIAALGKTLSNIRHQLDAPGGENRERPFSAWRMRLENYFGYILTFRGDSYYDLDPYTRDFAFLPLFKLLHIACNQFGLKIDHELYTYTLLAAADEVDT